MQIEVFTDINRKTRFRIRAANGEVVAQSEAYEYRKDAFDTVELLRRDVGSAMVEDLTEGQARA